MPSMKYSIQSDIPADALMQTILDFASYPDFVETVQQTEIRKSGPPVWEVYFEIMVIRKLSYCLQLEQKDEFEIAWTLVEGFFVSNTGRWKLQPNEQGTEVTYEVAMQLDTFLPSMIRRSLGNQLLPKVVEAFIEETRARIALQRIDSTDN